MLCLANIETLGSPRTPTHTQLQARKPSPGNPLKRKLAPSRGRGSGERTGRQGAELPVRTKRTPAEDRPGSQTLNDPPPHAGRS